jgi:hypothetical protein
MLELPSMTHTSVGENAHTSIAAKTLGAPGAAVQPLPEPSPHATTNTRMTPQILIRSA